MPMINQYLYLSISALLPVSGLADKGEQKKPNVILIVSDDQGYGDLSFHGNNLIRTPNMDRLAVQSTRFTNFIVSPVSAPTRASLLTGRYNYRAQVWDTWKSRENMHPEEITIAEVLKSSGYRTGLFGKWHLGYNHPLRPIDQGFDRTVEFQEYTRLDSTRFNPMMKINGRFETRKGFLTDIIFDEAVSYIRESASDEKPFFAYIASFLPHYGDSPMVPEQYVRGYDSTKGLGKYTREVYGMIGKLDENIGRILDEVERLGISDNTIIIFISDNGPQFQSPLSEGEEWRFNNGLRGSKGNVYEGGIKVPCFVKWKGITEPGREINTLAAHIDILPTIADMTGSSMPQVRVDGVSLYPLLLNSGEEWPERNIKIQFDRQEVPSTWNNCTVRGERYKLVNGSELYDLWQDPAEQHDLSSKYPDMVASLRREYEEWFKDVSSTRGFSTTPTTIGYDDKIDVMIQFFDQTESGWPVKVVNSGPYDVIVNNVNPGIFPEGAEYILTFGKTELRSSIKQGADKIEFRKIKLVPGEYYFNIRIEGKMLKKYIPSLYMEDKGYLSVMIKRR